MIVLLVPSVSWKAIRFHEKRRYGARGVHAGDPQIR